LPYRPQLLLWLQHLQNRWLKRTTVEGNILLAVLPGTLYKITGIGDASATALK
jgi:hypothetical protein